MSKRHGLVGPVVVCLLGVVLSGYGDTLRREVSTSYRFAAIGIASPASGTLLQKLDQWSTELEEVMHVRISFDVLNPLTVQARQSKGPVQVVPLQDGTARSPVQEVVITGTGDVPVHELREAFYWLLLNRTASLCTSPDKKPVGVPEWFSAGLARTFEGELRVRDLAEAMKEWQDGAAPPLGEIFTYRYLSEGSRSEKAWSMMLVSWILDQSTDGDLPRDMLCAWGKGERVDAIWLADRLGEHPERLWSLWVSSRRDVVIPGVLSGVSPAEVLRNQLNLGDVAYAGVLSMAPADVSGLEDLVRYHDEPWAIETALWMSTRIRGNLFFADDQFAGVVDQFLLFLDGISGDLRSYTGGLFGRHPSANRLLDILRSAIRSLEAWEQRERARERYVDEWQKRHEADRTLAGHGVDPDAARRWLDAVEKHHAYPGDQGQSR